MDFLKHLSPDQQFVLFSALKVAGVFAVVMPFVAYAVLAERKIAAAIQDRLGPNRVGWFGIFQPVADGVKAFLKEDFTPAHVRKAYFWLAPMIVMIPSLLTMAVIPFGSQIGGQKMVIADLNVGILYTFGIVSLGVYGIVLAGYASNSKYPFLGGIRSSAQMISYEAALGLSVATVVVLSGSLHTSAIVAAQHGGFLYHWNIIRGFGAPAAIFFIAITAEMTRPPFDLVEAEEELAGGFNLEYSSIGFALFYLAEYMALVTNSAIFTTLFLGGPDGPRIAGHSIGPVWFAIKVLVLLYIYVWIRATLPRLRYDQLMDLGWKRLIPGSLALLLIVAGARVGWRYGLLALSGSLIAFVVLVRAIEVGQEHREEEGALNEMEAP